MRNFSIPYALVNGMYSHPLARAKFDTFEETEADFDRLAVLFNFLAGRADKEGNLLPGQQFLTEKELIKGVEHPLDEQNIQTRHRLRRKSELNPKHVDLRTDAERNRDSIAKRVEDEKLAKLPASEAMLLQAENQVSIEKQRRAFEQARKESLSTPRAVALIDQMETVSVYAKFDQTVPGYLVEELEHLSTLLNKFGDVENVSARFDELQKQMAQDIRVEESHSRAVVDRINARSQMILTGSAKLDVEPIIYNDFLDRKHARLTFNGESITVPFAEFDGRSEAQLLHKFFNAGGAA